MNTNESFIRHNIRLRQTKNTFRLVETNVLRTVQERRNDKGAIQRCPINVLNRETRKIRNVVVLVS